MRANDDPKPHFFTTGPLFDSLFFFGPMITKESCNEFKRMCPLSQYMDDKQYQREVMPYIPKDEVKKSVSIFYNVIQDHFVFRLESGSQNLPLD